MAKKRPKHIPTAALQGDSKKEVRKALDIQENYDKQMPSWQFHLIDHDGPFGWKKIDSEEIWDIFSNRIKDKEYINWSELKQANSHNVELYKLTKEARERLVEIGQEDIDQLFSLRISGKERIWGIRDRFALKILWWDPEHEVCPSTKRNT